MIPARLFQSALRALLLVAAVLLASSRSFASTPAPMCSEDGRSVTAPPIMTPNRGLVLEAPKECSELIAFLCQSPDDNHGPYPVTQSDLTPPRAMPVRAFEPVTPYAGRLGIEKAPGSALRRPSGGIDRPPK